MSKRKRHIQEAAADVELSADKIIQASMILAFHIVQFAINLLTSPCSSRFSQPSWIGGCSMSMSLKDAQHLQPMPALLFCKMHGVLQV